MYKQIKEKREGPLFVFIYFVAANRASPKASRSNTKTDAASADDGTADYCSIIKYSIEM